MRWELLVPVFLAVSCGQHSTGGSDAATPPTEQQQDPEQQTTPQPATDQASYHSMLVADASSLPDCTAEAEGWLVYIKSDSVFKTCASNNWEQVDIRGERGEQGEKGDAGDAGANGPKGTDGVDGQDLNTIVSVTNIRSSITDLCTRNAEDTCFFANGSAVRHAGGLVQFDSRYFYGYSDSNPDGDTDTDWITSTLLCPPDIEWSATPIDQLQRGDSDEWRMLWLKYDRESDSFSLVYDDDGDGELEPSDSVVEYLTETLIYGE